MSPQVRALEYKNKEGDRRNGSQRTSSSEGITWERLAKTLRINQAGVSNNESWSDIFVSTLRKAIEAMGDHLEIRAKFPAGEVRMGQFGGLARKQRLRSGRGAGRGLLPRPRTAKLGS